MVLWCCSVCKIVYHFRCEVTDSLHSLLFLFSYFGHAMAYSSETVSPTVLLPSKLSRWMGELNHIHTHSALPSGQLHRRNNVSSETQHSAQHERREKSKSVARSFPVDNTDFSSYTHSWRKRTQMLNNMLSSTIRQIEVMLYQNASFEGRTASEGFSDNKSPSPSREVFHDREDVKLRRSRSTRRAATVSVFQRKSSRRQSVGRSVSRGCRSRPHFRMLKRSTHLRRWCVQNVPLPFRVLMAFWSIVFVYIATALIFGHYFLPYILPSGVGSP